MARAKLVFDDSEKPVPAPWPMLSTGPVFSLCVLPIQKRTDIRRRRAACPQHALNFESLWGSIALHVCREPVAHHGQVVQRPVLRLRRAAYYSTGLAAAKSGLSRRCSDCSTALAVD